MPEDLNAIEQLRSRLKQLPQDKIDSTILDQIHSNIQALEDLHLESELRLEQAQRLIAQNRKQNQDFEKINRQFLSVCAHDLRSPTNSILSFLEILMMEGDRMPLNERQGIYARMDRAAKHMLNLIGDLLESVKIESGRFQLETEARLLSELCKETLLNLQASFQSKDITVELKSGPGELKVMIDPQKFTQILHNLLSNALKFTSRGGNVELIIVNQGKGMVLEIRDNGQGIPKNEIPKLFEKFSKVSTQSTEGEKSTGLGLSIVKQLVDLHHGNIEVKSKVNEGTSFIITLPVVESKKLLHLFSGKTRP